MSQAFCKVRCAIQIDKEEEPFFCLGLFLKLLWHSTIKPLLIFKVLPNKPSFIYFGYILDSLARFMAIKFGYLNILLK